VVLAWGAPLNLSSSSFFLEFLFSLSVNEILQALIPRFLLLIIIAREKSQKMHYEISKELQAGNGLVKLKENRSLFSTKKGVSQNCYLY